MGKDAGEKLISYRRFFHQYPETGWLTYLPTVYIADRLEMCGYEVYVGTEILGDEPLMDPPSGEEITAHEKAVIPVLREQGVERPEYWLARMRHRTGVIAILDTGRPGATKAYRFDMDALAVGESNDSGRTAVREQFLSKYPGFSHACGHDGHMALGIALAEDAAKEKAKYNGKYIFIFQPAEEGVRGAMAFCKRWTFGHIDELYCCHIGFAPANTFVSGAKGFLATTKFDVIFHGKSAHAGLAPERGRNALLAAAESVMSMQQIEKPKNHIARLNVGKLLAGESRNTIPANARMQVETRGDIAEVNQYMKEQALTCIAEACKKYGVTYDITYQGESVSASSDRELSTRVLRIAEELGRFQSYEETRDFGASDDAAVFMDMVQKQGGQAVYMLLGTSICGQHHEDIFDFDEEVLSKALQIYLKTFEKRC